MNLKKWVKNRSLLKKEIIFVKEKYTTIAGILFFLAGMVILMGIITAEAYYPDQPVYTTHNSMISDLGSTMPPNSIITQPSATIFNLSMIITGILILLGTYSYLGFQVTEWQWCSSDYWGWEL